MDVYERHDLTKGRVMQVDEDLAPYFANLNSSSINPDLASMPSRLQHEHVEYLNGLERGPLMMQELEFERRFVLNMATRQSFNVAVLQDIGLQSLKSSRPVELCYCRAED